MTVANERKDIELLHPTVKRLRLSNDHMVSPGIIPVLGKKHCPPALPNELWHKIFDLLPVLEIKAFRATCKLWSVVGERHLFPIFRFSLRRDDFSRFEQVGSRGAFLKGVKELYIEAGKTGILWITESLALLYHGQQMIHGRKHENEVAMTNAIAEYAEWNVAAYENDNNFRDIHLLIDTFRSIKALDSVYITRRSPRIHSRMLLQAWSLCRQADYFRRAESEFEVLLNALERSGITLKHLSHDQLPVTFFKRDFQDVERFMKPLEGLQCLHITFDATEPPRKAFWVGLGQFLQSLPRLMDLRFGFFPICDMFRNGRSWQSCDDMTTWYVPLWKILGTFTWKKLKSLRMDGMVFCEAGLLELLERHASTLNTLELSNIGFRYGNFKRFFVWLKSLLRLRTFSVWGYIQAYQCRQQKWMIRPRIFPGDKAWDTRATGFYQDFFLIFTNLHGAQEYPKGLLSEALQAFVLQQGPWPAQFSLPMPELDSRGLSAGISDRATINRIWDELQDGIDDIKWELGREDDVDIHGEEILEYYDSDGYDVHGFDIDGYNRAGVFHTDPSFLVPNSLSRISFVTAKRRILRRIKDKIPRLDGVKIGT
ncbi:hypothetical protein ONS95_010929 [Cadophora gregata]|uniref:uncharacterized protein n=1 Tax=Cadophora gregata TaxID=51156 RepID=UPI0026DD0115|nr:uncharacterized protein ONS95_010929 [Cadophora gregata]KAK0119482.1 hypothetical protein ONS95_010929 [Cadophora gregata]